MAFRATIRVPSLDRLAHVVTAQLVGALDGALNASLRGIERGMARAVRAAVRASPTYESLSSGRLWHELGVVHPQAVTDSLLAAIGDSITATNRGVRVFGRGVEGTVEVGVLGGSFARAFSLPGMSFRSENGFQVPWLEWLLTSGDSIVLEDHFYIDKAWATSRTGRGIMVKSHRGWHVPAEFAGTAADNWLTRVIETTRDELGGIAVAEVARNLR